MYTKNATIQTDPVKPANNFLSEFTADVIFGLQQSPKKLSSKYFYDAAGSKLFQQIMNLPEYYPTRTEFKILEEQKAAIVSFFKPDDFFHLVELGAGDGLKTKILLRELMLRKARMEYVPVDISETALHELEQSLHTAFPQLRTDSFAGDYFKALRWLKENKKARKIVVFLGSNIGNFEEDEGQAFLQEVVRYLNPGDSVLIGFDLRKDPETIRQAYDDAAGITAAFNLNLLHRINHESGADFNPDQFSHFTDYDPVTGVVKSYLVSRKEQEVLFPEQQISIKFNAWEPIHTENSRKYTLPQINRLGESCGLKIEQVFTDSRHYFADILFTLNL